MPFSWEVTVLVPEASILKPGQHGADILIQYVLCKQSSRGREASDIFGGEKTDWDVYFAGDLRSL